MSNEKASYNPQQNHQQGPPPYEQNYSQDRGENASYYGGSPAPNQQGYPPQGGPEDDRGLGSTLVGGAVGGYMGHQAGGGMATLGGAALGAAGMNMATHAIENHQNQQAAQAQAQAYPPQQGYGPPPPGYGPPPGNYGPPPPGYGAPSPGPAYGYPGTTTTTTTTTTTDDGYGYGALGRGRLGLGRGLGGGLGGPIGGGLPLGPGARAHLIHRDMRRRRLGLY